MWTNVADAIKRRKINGSPFSIVAIAEGAMSKESAAELDRHLTDLENATGPEEKQEAKAKVQEFQRQRKGSTARLAEQLEALTGLEARLTILGHVQRGGTPSARDRLLATRLGTATTDLIAAGEYGKMVAIHGNSTLAVPLEDIAGKKKLVPLDHPQLLSARRIGTCFGD